MAVLLGETDDVVAVRDRFPAALGRPGLSEVRKCWLRQIGNRAVVGLAEEGELLMFGPDTEPFLRLVARANIRSALDGGDRCLVGGVAAMRITLSEGAGRPDGNSGRVIVPKQVGASEIVSMCRFKKLQLSGNRSTRSLVPVADSAWITARLRRLPFGPQDPGPEREWR